MHSKSPLQVARKREEKIKVVQQKKSQVKRLVPEVMYTKKKEGDAIKASNK